MSDPATVAPLGSRLTPAERKALEIRAKVDSDDEAARRLGISVNTLRVQLANARSRLGVKSTQRAIREAGV